MIRIPNPVNNGGEAFENAMTALRLAEVTFSKREASKILKSKTVLEKLVALKRIRVSYHSDNCRNGEWKCNAEDVLRYSPR